MPPAPSPSCRRRSSACAAGCNLPATASRASGTPTGTTSSRAPASPISWTRAPSLRGGIGVYTVPFIIGGVYQPGFSQSTSLVPTLDRGLTFQATLANPFPDGVLAPSGATSGADTALAQDISRFVPLDLKNSQNMRYTLNVQRELPGQWLLEVGYAGSRGWDLTTGGGGAGRRDRAERHPRSVPVDQPAARPGHDRLSVAARRQPVRQPDTRHRLQRRDDRALAAAAPLPAVRQRAHLRRRRHQPLSTRRRRRSRSGSRGDTRCWPPTRGRSSPSACSG